MLARTSLSKIHDGRNMDTLGFEPRAFRMRSGCDTTTPCARLDELHALTSLPPQVHFALRIAAVGVTLRCASRLLCGNVYGHLWSSGYDVSLTR